MGRTLRILLVLAVLAIAVPLVPFLLVGARLDHAVGARLDPPPPPATLAALEVGVLAADVLLPVPSSVVATLGGAVLGVAGGTACAWLGMTLGAAAGWALGRLAGRPALAGIDAADRAALARHERRLGPLLVVLTRPLPLLAEAVAILGGATGMPARTFIGWAAAGNLAVALAWSLAGAHGARADAVQWVLGAALVVPLALACLAMRRPFGRDAGVDSSALPGRAPR
ncbi:MAG: VTT domain-containing protein [Planctomycetaceae bacterium]